MYSFHARTLARYPCKNQTVNHISSATLLLLLLLCFWFLVLCREDCRSAGARYSVSSCQCDCAGIDANKIYTSTAILPKHNKRTQEGTIVHTQKPSTSVPIALPLHPTIFPNPKPPEVTLPNMCAVGCVRFVERERKPTRTNALVRWHLIMTVTLLLSHRCNQCPPRTAHTATQPHARTRHTHTHARSNSG